MTGPGQFSPVFIYGALRSGTTLFRLMLNSHGALHNPGEADFLFDAIAPTPAASTGWRYDRHALFMERIFRAHALDLPADIDGRDLLEAMIAQFEERRSGLLSLNVHRHADRIAALFPDARFIHLLRDPRDVARSSVGMGWAGTSYHGVDHWIETERAWDRAAIDPARVLTLQFETLLADLPKGLSAVCDFLGVPFSDSMLRYHEHTSYGPPDLGTVGKWRHAALPREIALVEGKCGDLLGMRGYVPSHPAVRPGAAEAAWLALRDVAGRWRWSIARVGLPLFLAGRITRLAGLRRAHDRVQLARDARLARQLR